MASSLACEKLNWLTLLLVATGASSAEQRGADADPGAQSQVEDPEAAAAAYDPDAMFAAANDPDQVFNWTQMLDWAGYMLQQGQSPAEVST